MLGYSDDIIRSHNAVTKEGQERIAYLWDRGKIDAVLSAYGKLTKLLTSKHTSSLEIELRSLGLHHPDLLTSSDREKIFAEKVSDIWDQLIMSSEQKGYDRLNFIVKERKVPIQKLYDLSDFISRQKRIYLAYASRIKEADSVANRMADIIAENISGRIDAMDLREGIFTDYEIGLLCHDSGSLDVITDILFKSANKGVS